MYKYTTPTHVFKFPDDPSIYRRIEIIYAQRGEILLKKTEEDITFGEAESKTAYITLTQEETALFNDKFPVQIQVRVMTPDKKVFASAEMTAKVHDILNEEILEG